MKKRILFLVITSFVVFLAYKIGRTLEDKAITTSISPSSYWQATILEPYRLFFDDRNLKVVLRNLKENSPSKTIFVTPDENGYTKQRFLWSKDETKLLIVGEDFIFRGSNFKLKNGEGLYFLYDIPSGQKWCNCNGKEKFFSFFEISKIDFHENLSPETESIK